MNDDLRFTQAKKDIKIIDFGVAEDMKDDKHQKTNLVDFAVDPPKIWDSFSRTSSVLTQRDGLIKTDLLLY